MPLTKKLYVWFVFLLLQGWFLFSISSCTVVRNYPKDQPFIFENTVNIRSVPKAQKADLKTLLEEQLEDSARAVSASQIPWPRAPWIIPVPVMDKPFPFVEKQVGQSATNMQNLMISKGYRSAQVVYDSSLKIRKGQQRVAVTYQVEAGQLYRIDSIDYKLADSGLNALLVADRKNALLRKGDPFDYGLIDQELSRMVSLFRSNGYYKITREDFYVEADSGFAALIDPSIDPFEYISRLAEIGRQKKDQPEIDIYIRQYPNRDSSRSMPYSVGSFTVWPDAPASLSEISPDTTEVIHQDFRIISLENTFKPDFITRFIPLKPGKRFNQEDFSKTLNNLNKLGVWQNINVSSKTNDSLRTIDYELFLTPAKRQFFTVDLEGSSVLNTNQLVLVGAGRVGLALNFRLRNRNIGKRGIQLENSLRTGIEFNDFSRILSSEVTFGNRLSIPWLLTPFRKKFEDRFLNGRTIVTGDVSYINRFQYYQLRSITSFIGYEWKPKPYVTWQFKPLNVELTRIRQDSLFTDAIRQNPLLVYAYNNGLIIGNNVSYSRSFNGRSQRHLNSLRLYGEESGLLFGTLSPGQTAPGKSLEDLYKFLRLDIDFRHYINWKQSSFVFRSFVGVGKAFNTRSRQGEITLPFFKSYFAGGPNSMRGWQLRKLGIGSNVFFDTLANGVFNDKYADIQLEANLEYRFNMFRLFGFWIRGAAFTDIGNIWYRNDIDGNLPGAQFRFSTLYRDLAIASGAGVRVDFTYFLLRFDWGFPIKDPRYGPDKGSSSFFTPRSGGWFVDGVWNKPVFQFAIGYPF